MTSAPDSATNTQMHVSAFVSGELGRRSIPDDRREVAVETLVLPGSRRHSAVSCKPFLGNFLENQAGEPPGDRNLSDQASLGREGLLPTTDGSRGQSAELM